MSQGGAYRAISARYNGAEAAEMSKESFATGRRSWDGADLNSKGVRRHVDRGWKWERVSELIPRFVLSKIHSSSPDCPRYPGLMDWAGSIG